MSADPKKFLRLSGFVIIFTEVLPPSRMKKSIVFLLGAAALLSNSAFAQTASTTPVGVVTVSLPAGRSSAISVPLIGDSVYSGPISSFTPNTITVSGTPWTAGQFTGTTPYFVQIKSGLHVGRMLRITSNTASSITVNTSDNLGLNVPLNVSGKAVVAGDTIQIITGDTLGSLFGTTVAEIAPLVGAARLTSADTVSTYDPLTGKASTYFFNTSNGYWTKSGVVGNQNNLVIIPGQELGLLTLSSGGTKTLTFMGTVPDVAPTLKLEPKRVEMYGTTFPVDITLAQLNFGTNWVTNARFASADQISIWQPTMNKYIAYFKKPDNMWYQNGVAASVNATVIPAGTAINIQTVTAGLTGAQVLYTIPLPYSL